MFKALYFYFHISGQRLGSNGAETKENNNPPLKQENKPCFLSDQKNIKIDCMYNGWKVEISNDSCQPPATEYMGTVVVSNATANTGHTTSCPWLLPCLTMHKQNKTSLPQLNTNTKQSIKSDYCIIDISIYRNYDVYVMQCIISS